MTPSSPPHRLADPPSAPAPDESTTPIEEERNRCGCLGRRETGDNAAAQAGQRQERGADQVGRETDTGGGVPEHLNQESTTFTSFFAPPPVVDAAPVARPRGVGGAGSPRLGSP